MNADQIIPRRTKVIVEVLENDGNFKTKVINVMCDVKKYIFEDVISSRHRGYTFIDYLPLKVN